MSKKTGRKPVGKGKKKRHPSHPSQKPTGPAPVQQAGGTPGAEGGTCGEASPNTTETKQ